MNVEFKKLQCGSWRYLCKLLEVNSLSSKYSRLFLRLRAIVILVMVAKASTCSSIGV